MTDSSDSEWLEDWIDKGADEWPCWLCRSFTTHREFEFDRRRRGRNDLGDLVRSLHWSRTYRVCSACNLVSWVDWRSLHNPVEPHHQDLRALGWEDFPVWMMTLWAHR